MMDTDARLSNEELDEWGRVSNARSDIWSCAINDLVAEVRRLRALRESVSPRPSDLAYFKKRVAEWREMPILGHGLYARYQDAQQLLSEAESLLTAADAVGVSPPRCYLQENDAPEDHRIEEGVVCARCYGALADQNEGLYAAVQMGAEEQKRLRSLIAELIETPLSDTMERARAALDV